MRKPPQLHKNGYAVSRDLASVLVCTEKLKPLGRETRRHPRRQLDKLAASIDEFGFVLPVIIDVDSRVVAGWGLVVAALVRSRASPARVDAPTARILAPGHL
jgi:hypothetical protein